MLGKLKLATLVASLALATTPVMAQAVPPDANKALWCATAFGAIEPQARATGATAIADNFLKYTKALTTSSHDLLVKAGFTEDQITALAAKYTKDVPEQMTQPTADSFSQQDCTALVDPAAAAAMAAPDAPTPPAADAPVKPAN